MPCSLEDIGDGAASDLMPQIGQCALDSRIPPRSILERHAQDEIDDSLHEARPTGPTPVAVVPLGRHQFPVPSQERVRCDQGLKFVQNLASKRVGFSGESAAFGIGEANAPPAQALLEHAVLFLEVLDHVHLMTVDPTREHHQQQVNR
jgi:hypothetical protein